MRSLLRAIGFIPCNSDVADGCCGAHWGSGGIASTLITTNYNSVYYSALDLFVVGVRRSTQRNG
jgi:hypothetical protein